jgi:hypothetical protein
VGADRKQNCGEHVECGATPCVRVQARGGGHAPAGRRAARVGRNGRRRPLLARGRRPRRGGRGCVRVRQRCRRARALNGTPATGGTSDMLMRRSCLPYTRCETTRAPSCARRRGLGARTRRTRPHPRGRSTPARRAPTGRCAARVGPDGRRRPLLAHERRARRGGRGRLRAGQRRRRARARTACAAAGASTGGGGVVPFGRVFLSRCAAGASERDSGDPAVRGSAPIGWCTGFFLDGANMHAMNETTRRPFFPDFAPAEASGARYGWDALARLCA